MPRIDPVSSRQVYANRWMTVREDVIRRSDGAEGIYGVIDKPDYALVIARVRVPTAGVSHSSSSSATRWACGAGSSRRAPWA